MRYLELTLGLIKLSDIHIRQAICFSDGLANLSLTCVRNKAVDAKRNSIGVPATWPPPLWGKVGERVKRGRYRQYFRCRPNALSLTLSHRERGSGFSKSESRRIGNQMSGKPENVQARQPNSLSPWEIARERASKPQACLFSERYESVIRTRFGF